MDLQGYSGTPLAKKLGIKPGFKIRVINEPQNYFSLFTDMPEIKIMTSSKIKKDLIHYFVKEEKSLIKNIIPLKEELEQNGMLWISWPKKSSGVKTDVTENTIRNLAIKMGLVDVKVCSIDEVWSALKLVIPLKDRKLIKDQ